ncbi:MAG: hypothetical protein ACRCX2_10110 [Paraclostridium sp.]
MRIVEFIEREIYLLILKQRERIIDRSQKKIKKYELKLLTEKRFLKAMVDDLKSLIDKGTYM